MGRRRIEGSAIASSATSPSAVPVASIAHNPRNPRENYEDVAELAESMRQVGVLQPLGVVRYEVFLARYPEYETAIGAAHWVVVQGNRRLAAARCAELAEVPVVIQERLGREDTFDESVLIENIHRKDLPPLREAAVLRELVDKHGSQRKVAQAVGKTPGWVTQRLSLLKLVPQLQEKLAAGALTIAEARDLAQIPEERQLQAYEHGAPYRDPAQSVAEMKPEVRAEQDANALSSAPLGGVYAVNTPEPSSDGNGHRSATPQPAAEPAREEGQGVYRVNTRSVSTASAEDGDPHPKQELVATLRRRFTPGQVVTVLRESYGPEQCAEIARQLQK